MSDVIRLLPDHIANQIAAGEVVQRPASVVKELMENSIDAGATKVDLVIKDGGRTLIQIIDNGSGMSEGDARMAFERHATSKISSADDLFALHTKGFRGEALASVAAVAHVQMKTKRAQDELGTELIIEGSKVKSQEAVMCADGTSIAVKNLFFNVPARRNFLGKDLTEYRKIVDEFLRIVLVHPEIEFSLHHNGDEVYQLQSANLRQRVVQVFGKSFNQRLVPVSEETDIVKITGFVTKPEAVKATRDQSMFFVNNRFFKDRYFHHAVMNAYEGLIQATKYPPYFLYFEVPASAIDVNVHPTKTEIKFEENQSIYAIIRSAVKQALGQFNIAPTLDFEQETSFDTSPVKKGEPIAVPQIKVNPDYNPFQSSSKPSSGGGWDSASSVQLKPQREDWENFYEGVKTESQEEEVVQSSMNEELDSGKKAPVQLAEKYILTSTKNGLLLIDQYRAHFRILFEQYLNDQKKEGANSQQLLFPVILETEKSDQPIWDELIPELLNLGFDLRQDKESGLEVSGVPAEAAEINPQELLVAIFEEFKTTGQDIDSNHRVAASLAKSVAIRGGTRLNEEEMNYIVDALFATSSPQIAPNGKKIIEQISLEEIIKRFD